MRHVTGETGSTSAVVGGPTDTERALPFVVPPFGRAPIGRGAPEGAPLSDTPVGHRDGEGVGPPFDQPRLHPFAGMSLGAIAERAGLKRIDVVAWRDFDDPEAGGSELHAHRVMTEWSRAGLDVTLFTSSVPDARALIRRDGYRVVRR